MYNVLIIGCGNIAGLLDKDAVENYKNPFTHAKAYKLNNKFKVKACVDIDINKSRDFQKIWSIENSYSSIEDVLNSDLKFDIISICSPSKEHIKDLNTVIKFNPKLVFCEKPLSESLVDAKKIISKYKEKKIHLLLNFNRRFDNSIKNFRQKLDSREYGQLRSVTCHYNKGFINNGSHLIDLLHLLLGSLDIKWVGEPICDFNSDDPSYPMILSSKSVSNISIMPTHSKDYSLFEIDFIFSNKRVKILDGGMNWSYQDVKNDKNFKNYKILSTPKIIKGDYKNTFHNAIILFDKIIKGTETNIFSGDDLLKTVRLQEKIRNKYSKTKLK